MKPTAANYKSISSSPGKQVYIEKKNIPMIALQI